MHRRTIAVVLAVVLAAGWRLAIPALGLPWNLELLTSVSVLAALLMPRRWALIAPLTAVACSDLLLGNTAMLWVTWSAWLLIAGGALGARRWLKRGEHRSSAAVAGAGVGYALAATGFFFLWTNAGFWVLTRGELYQPGLAGLGAALLAGVPFVRAQLLGNLVLVPLAAELGNRILARDLAAQRTVVSCVT